MHFRSGWLSRVGNHIDQLGFILITKLMPLTGALDYFVLPPETGHPRHGQYLRILRCFNSVSTLIHIFNKWLSLRKPKAPQNYPNRPAITHLGAVTAATPTPRGPHVLTFAQAIASREVAGRKLIIFLKPL
jgi:hypothetical protein